MEMLSVLVLIIFVTMAYSPKKKEIHEEIIINASSTEVWSVLTDLESWEEWNPFIIKSEGKVIEGEQLINTMKQGDKTYVFKPKAITVIDNRQFTWLGRMIMPGLFDGKHSYFIEETDDDRIKLIQHESFSGILSGMILKRIGEETSANFRAMNEALKSRVEGSLTGTTSLRKKEN